MNFKGMFQEMGDWLSRPLREDMSVSQLLLIFGLLIVVAFVVFDMLRILKSWSDATVEVVADAVTG